MHSSVIAMIRSSDPVTVQHELANRAAADADGVALSSRLAAGEDPVRFVSRWGYNDSGHNDRDRPWFERLGH
jgi:hypothetical protein